MPEILIQAWRNKNRLKVRVYLNLPKPDRKKSSKTFLKSNKSRHLRWTYILFGSWNDFSFCFNSECMSRNNKICVEKLKIKISRNVTGQSNVSFFRTVRKFSFSLFTPVKMKDFKFAYSKHNPGCMHERKILMNHWFVETLEVFNSVSIFSSSQTIKQSHTCCRFPTNNKWKIVKIMKKKKKRLKI